MKMLKKLTLLFLIICSANLWAQDIPEPMSPPRLVNDFAGTLSQDEQYTLEKKLRDYHDTTSSQIYVVIVGDLLGYESSDFAFRLGQKWGIGQKGKDNGILILVKPKIGNEKGYAFIATGYGMEEFVPDAITNRIVDLEMIPYFKQNNYYGGIDAAINTIMELSAGRYTADQYAKKQSSPYGAVIFVIIVIILAMIFRGNSKTRGKTLGSNLPFWLAMGMLSSGRGGGGFGNFSSGSGGFGGFGGGGGGSFGGGGAGGSW